MLGVLGASYRAACRMLETMLGFRPVSHETIRQQVIRVGGRVEQEEEQKRSSEEGTRKVPVLFVEVDGLNVSMQHEATHQQEVKIMTSHEGWQPRHPASREYELVGPSYHLAIDEKRRKEIRALKKTCSQCQK